MLQGNKASGHHKGLQTVSINLPSIDVLSFRQIPCPCQVIALMLFHFSVKVPFLVRIRNQKNLGVHIAKRSSPKRHASVGI